MKYPDWQTVSAQNYFSYTMTSNNDQIDVNHVHTLRLLQLYQLFMNVLINYLQKSYRSKNTTYHVAIQYNSIYCLQVSIQYPSLYQEEYNGWIDGS